VLSTIYRPVAGEATPAQTYDAVAATKTMLDRTDAARKRDCDARLSSLVAALDSLRAAPRDIHEDACDVALPQDDDGGLPQIARQRNRVEMRFARLKAHRGFELPRLRGASQAFVTSSTSPPSCRTARR
jgi:hypothetical protein